MAPKLRLVVDENIPLASEAFGPCGEVIALPGRAISRESLRDADALVVRAVTRVDADLLRGTPVRFVGTATTGFEHLDVEALQAAGVQVAVALGCNARSVAEWVVAAILELTPPAKDWRGQTLGIVGRGRIGSMVADLGEALGLRVLVSDPPLEDAGAPELFVPLDELLSASDVVTLHVPLTREGPHPTFHLIVERELSLLKPGAILLNASRGAVLNNAAALAWLESGRGASLKLALDVFESEPDADRRLVAACALATPHVAGYSREGKVEGTRMIAQALREFFHLPLPAWEPVLPPPAEALISLTASDELGQMREAVRRAYNIRADDAAFRAGLKLEGRAWADHFDALRKNYPQRREFRAWTLQGNDSRVQAILQRLGFGK